MTAKAKRLVPMSLPKPRADARVRPRPTEVGCPKAACEISPTKKSSATTCRKALRMKSNAWTALALSGAKYPTVSVMRYPGSRTAAQMAISVGAFLK